MNGSMFILAVILCFMVTGAVVAMALTVRYLSALHAKVGGENRDALKVMVEQFMGEMKDTRELVLVEKKERLTYLDLARTRYDAMKIDPAEKRPVMPQTRPGEAPFDIAEMGNRRLRMDDLGPLPDPNLTGTSDAEFV